MEPIKIEKCPYCGNTSIGIGYQLGQGSLSASKMGLTGCKVIHMICRSCGSILYSRVEKPQIFKEDK